MGEEGHGCHAMLVRILNLLLWQEGKASVVGHSHMTQHQALDVTSSHNHISTKLGWLGKKGGEQKMTASCVYVKQQKFWNHAGFTELKMQKNDYIIVGRQDVFHQKKLTLSIPNKQSAALSLFRGLNLA